MLSIIEKTRKKAENSDLKKLGLMGTRFTMEADFFKKPFHDNNMVVVAPEQEDQL